MKVFANRQVGTPPTGYKFSTIEGEIHPCCAGHAAHAEQPDSNACFFAYAVRHTTEETHPTGELSDCQAYPCMRKTTKSIKSDLCPRGKYLCDSHRSTEMLAGFTPYVGKGYQLKV